MTDVSKFKFVDVYSANRFDFEQFVADGYVGVIFKGGQGEWPDVPRVRPEWWKQAKAVGLMRGWYWLVDARYRPSFQVEALKKATNMDWGELGMWLDCEKPVLSMRDRDYQKLPYAGWRGVYDVSVGVQKTGASQFADGLPGIYTSPGAYKLIFGGAPIESQKWFSRAPLWTAQYYWRVVLGVSKPVNYGYWNERSLHWWQWRENPDINLWMQSDADFSAIYPLDVLPPIEDQIDAGDTRTAVVTSAASRGLYVRSGPGKTYPTVDEPLHPGDHVEVIEVSEPQGPNGDRWAKLASERWAAMRYGGVEYMTWSAVAVIDLTKGS